MIKTKLQKGINLRLALKRTCLLLVAFLLIAAASDAKPKFVSEANGIGLHQKSIPDGRNR